MEVLNRLGLQGPSQWHVAPIVLVPDERAHQVFEGFGSGTSEVARSLQGRYPGATPAFVLQGNGRAVCTLTEVAELAWTHEAVLVVPAIRSDHSGGFYGLVHIVDRLLGPGGCPWDQEQTHDSLKRYLIEEAHELIDAIDAQDESSMIEELGDVLLQPVMHTQIEALVGHWGIEDAIKSISDKLVRRHPHVFGDTKVADSREVLKNWDAIKEQEKETTAQTQSKLDGIPRSMPALSRALEVSVRAARSGFEWESIEGVWKKLSEEEAELKEAIEVGIGISEELGDLLFTVVNLGRWLGVEPESSLRAMLDRFTVRYKLMEQNAKKPINSLTAPEWDELWEQAKSGSS